MVPPRARGYRLRLEVLEDRLTLGDAGPLVAAILSGLGVSGPIEPGPSDGGLPKALDDTPRDEDADGLASGSADGPAPAISFEADDPKHSALDRGETEGPRPAPQPPPAGFDGALIIDVMGPAGPLAPGIDVASSAAVLAAGALGMPFAPAAARAGLGAPPAGPVAMPDQGSADEPDVPLPSPEPDVTARVSRLTNANRNAPTMTGGWNPALRGVLVMADGSRWFAAETGTDVQVNSAMVYYRRGPTGWQAVGSVALPPGIQQNMATVTDGRMIYSYGCTRTSVIETWFDTTKPRWNMSTGNAVMASGRPIDPGAASNYVGAAWRNGTRVVWWSTVGAGGAGGQWAYAYNGGGGWNGPVVSGLGGYTNVGYVRSQFDDKGRLHLVGEGYLGKFPGGQRYLMATTVALGNAARWAPVLPAVARSPLDLWKGDGGVHYLYRVATDKVGYWFGGPGARPTVFEATQARFVSAGDQVGLVLAYQRSVEVRLVPLAAAAGPIDWAAVPPLTFELPARLKAAGVSAIWTADEARQPHVPDHPEFAISGGYPVRDNLVYYVTIEGSNVALRPPGYNGT